MQSTLKTVAPGDLGTRSRQASRLWRPLSLAGPRSLEKFWSANHPVLQIVENTGRISWLGVRDSCLLSTSRRRVEACLNRPTSQERAESERIGWVSGIRTCLVTEALTERLPDQTKLCFARRVTQWAPRFRSRFHVAGAPKPRAVNDLAWSVLQRVAGNHKMRLLGRGVAGSESSRPDHFPASGVRIAPLTP